MTLETDRLFLRQLTQADFAPLCAILQDVRVMYAYEHAFPDTEVQEWLDNQLRRYREDGFGLWAVVCKESGQVIGQCGITLQAYHAAFVPEIGYLFCHAAWHKGYAIEAAKACKAYAFDTLGFDTVYSIIRDSNTASKAVALKNGMVATDTLIKHYYGIDMPHTVFCVRR